MDSSNTEAITSYTLLLPGKNKAFDQRVGTGDDVRVQVAVAVLYNGGTRLNLAPAVSNLKIRRPVEVIVSGTNSVTDLAGNHLDGDGDGIAGGDFLAMVGAKLSFLDHDGDLVTVSLANAARGERLQLTRSADGDGRHLVLPFGVYPQSVLSGKVKPAQGSDGKARWSRCHRSR
jgi:hypothetical protein